MDHASPVNNCGAGFYSKQVIALDTLSLLFGLGAALLGAASNLMAHKILAKVTLKDYLSVNFLFLALIMLPLMPWAFQFERTAQAIKFFILAGLIDALANYFFFLSFRTLNVITASSLLAISPLFTLALQPWLGNTAQWSPSSVPGVIICVGGIIWLIRSTSSQTDTKNATRHQVWQWVFPICSAALFGASVFLTRNLFLQEITNPISYYFLRSLLLAALFGVFQRPSLAWLQTRLLLPSVVRAVIVVGQWLCLLYGFLLAAPVTVKTLSEITPLFVLGFQILQKREKPSLSLIAPVLLLAIGMILLTIQAGSQ